MKQLREFVILCIQDISKDDDNVDYGSIAEKNNHNGFGQNIFHLMATTTTNKTTTTTTSKTNKQKSHT